MTIREQLTQELEQAPDELIGEVLDFCQFLKQKNRDNSSSMSQAGGMLNFLEAIKEIQAEVPPEEWDKLPHDGSINHDHYLYGSPRIEE